MNLMTEAATDTPVPAPLSRTARRNAMREAKKAAKALRGTAPEHREEGEQHVWHVTMTMDGEAIPGDCIVVASTPEFVERAMLDRYAHGYTPGELASTGFAIEQLDDGRFQGPFQVITAGPDEDGDLIDGPYASLLDATNRADNIFDIGDHDEGSRILDCDGIEVLRLELETRDTGVVRYRPGYY